MDIPAIPAKWFQKKKTLKTKKTSIYLYIYIIYYVYTYIYDIDNNISSPFPVHPTRLHPLPHTHTVPVLESSAILAQPTNPLECTFNPIELQVGCQTIMIEKAQNLVGSLLVLIVSVALFDAEVPPQSLLAQTPLVFWTPLECTFVRNSKLKVR